MLFVERLAQTIMAGLLCVASLMGGACAQTFLHRPVHMIIGFPRGSGADVLGRYFAGELSKLTRQPAIVDDEPGEDSLASMRTAAKADPDGHTILFASDAALVANRLMFKDADVSDSALAPIAACAQIAFALAIPPAAPIKDVQALVLKLKAKKDNAYGYTSRTSLLGGELFKQVTGSPAKPVLYRSSADAVRDLAEGNLDFMMLNGVFAADDIEQGVVKAVAVTAEERIPLLPDTPTMIEAGLPNFVLAPWWGVYAPARTPRAVIDQLEAWFLEIDSSPRTAEFLEGRAAAPLHDGSSATRSRLAADARKWAPFVEAAGLVLK